MQHPKISLPYPQSQFNSTAIVIQTLPHDQKCSVCLFWSSDTVSCGPVYHDYSLFIVYPPLILPLHPCSHSILCIIYVWCRKTMSVCVSTSVTHSPLIGRAMHHEDPWVLIWVRGWLMWRLQWPGQSPWWVQWLMGWTTGSCGTTRGVLGAPLFLFGGYPPTPNTKEEGGGLHVMVPLRPHSVGLLGGCLPLGFRGTRQGVGPRLPSAWGLYTQPGDRCCWLLFVFLCREWLLSLSLPQKRGRFLTCAW